jgi:hypothetical protein
MTIMTQSISAAIHIRGPTIRYAEIGRDGSALELRRLGQETLEFDVARALWEEDGSADALDQVKAVVREALEHTEATVLGLVVHPLDVYSFFMPISTGLSEQERGQRVAHQAALVTNTRSPNALHTTSRRVRTVVAGVEKIDWVHVLAVPQTVEERLETLTAALPVQDLVHMVSVEAVAWLMGRAESEQAPPAENGGSYRLAIGQYPAHTEYTLTHQGAWYHAHAAQEARSPENRAYFGVRLLNRIGVPLDEIGHLFVYGPDAESVPNGPFESIFGRPPVSLTLSEVLPPLSGQTGEDVSDAYVLCIGGALGTQAA